MIIQEKDRELFEKDKLIKQTEIELISQDKKINEFDMLL